MAKSGRNVSPFSGDRAESMILSHDGSKEPAAFKSVSEDPTIEDNITVWAIE